MLAPWIRAVAYAVAFGTTVNPRLSVKSTVTVFVNEVPLRSPVRVLAAMSNANVPCGRTVRFTRRDAPSHHSPV